MEMADLQEQLRQTLGDGYQIDRELPRGGMSRVFVVLDRALGREVVVKVLPPEMAGGVSLERFQREIQLVARLQHPHIVPVLSAGESGGVPYLMMPFVRGDSLRARLQKGGELPVDEAVRILRDVATALGHAHAEGVVHRDIKPENILLSGGIAVVTDFGVAKALSAAATSDTGRASDLTSVGVALGTPAYMAPEQASADPTTDQRADIYAWGVIAYEMLTGAPPFAGRPVHALLAAHVAEPVPPLANIRTELPLALSGLVMRCLAKRPADRPQTAGELVSELDSLTSTDTMRAQAARRPSRTRAKALWAMAALLVVAAGIGLFQMRGSLAGGGAPAGIKRIAVLPFANAGGSKDDEYFADGMGEELGAALGRVRGVQVASHRSSFSFKGKVIDVREIGRKLSVDAVLEGQVRRAGNRLRVTAQLTDVNNGLSLWADSYEREAKDVFAVQDNIARAIANALEVKFADKVSPALSGETQGTADPQAYDLYLRARFFWHQRGAENLRSAIRFFGEAIAKDPRFARAQAGLGSAYALLTEYSDKAPVDGDVRAERAAREALALDSTVAEAYLARGLVDVHRWKWAEAAAAYRKALALEPRNATAHQWYGELFYILGKADSSIAQMREAHALDPLAPISALALTYALHSGRRYQEAVREGERAAELAPALGIIRRVLAVLYVQLGDSARALANARLAVKLEPEQTNSIGILGYVAGASGRQAEAREALKQLESARAGAASPYAFLMAYLGVRDYPRALAAMDRLVAERSREFAGYSFVLDPVFDPLRGYPQFKEALARAGIGGVK